MKYVSSKKRHTAYLTNTAKIDFDFDNTRYGEGTRYKTNVSQKAGYTRRQFSWNRKESGMSIGTSAKLVMHDFVVTYHAPMPYSIKYHGAELVVSGEFSVSQVISIVDSLPEMKELGQAYIPVYATETLEGEKVTVEVVKLRRGKKTRESIYRDSEGMLKVKENLKPYSNAPKVYKRNRKALS